MEEEVKKTRKDSKHEKHISLVSLCGEAADIVREAKELEEKTVIFVAESKNFFEHMFSCCNSKKDVIEDDKNM